MMKTKAEIREEVTLKVMIKANVRKVTLCADSLNWIVNTLMADIACQFSESRINRHLNSMLTRVKTEVRG